MEIINPNIELNIKAWELFIVMVSTTDRHSMESDQHLINRTFELAKTFIEERNKRDELNAY